MQGFDNSVIFADGIDLSGNFPPTNQLGTDGYLLIGSSTGNPSAGLLSSTDSALQITGGDGTLDLTIGSGLTGTFLQINNNLGDVGSVSTARTNLGLNVTAKGSLIVGDGSTPTTLPVGTDGFVLKADSGEPSGLVWEAGGGGASPLTTKGDLYGYSTVDARIPIGVNGYVLTADSSQTLGLKWAAATGGVTSVTGTSNQIDSTGGATPVLSLSSTITTPGSLLTTTTLTSTTLFKASAGQQVAITTPGAYPYTTLITDFVILVDSSAARTITPLGSPATGQMYRIKDNVGTAATYNITITPSGKNIDGAASLVLNTNYGSVDIVYNGTQWNAL